MINEKSIRNLRIENFQSHELTEFAFDDGLNVIVGASDMGKSAVIRALRWLLFNEPRGSDFMRVGANQCRVSVELADGSRVTRERTPSKNRYIVVKPDGTEQIYEGFGNTVPREVSDVTGVAKVALDEDTETTLHLGTQLEPPFLLSETGSIKAKAIGRLNGVHIIDAASRDTSRDLTRLNSEEKGYREQLAEVEEELEQFSDLPYLENILLLVEEKQARMKELAQRRERLQRLAKQHREVNAGIAAVGEVLARTEQLDRAALLTERAQLAGAKTLRLSQNRAKLNSVRQGIGETDHILQRTEGLSQAEQSLGRGETQVAAYRRLSRLAESREQVKATLTKVDRVLEMTGRLGEAEVKVMGIEEAKQRLGRLTHLAGKRGETETLLEKIDRVLVRTEGVPRAEQHLADLAHKRTQAMFLHEVQGKKQEVERQLQRLNEILGRLARVGKGEEALERLLFLTDRQQRLMKIHGDLFDVGERLQKADVYLHTNALELTEKLDEYSRELKHSGSCPVCFAPIDEHTTERLVEEFKGGLHS
jgi:DNA repair protein SbcC/Rad50